MEAKHFQHFQLELLGICFANRSWLGVIIVRGSSTMGITGLFQKTLFQNNMA